MKHYLINGLLALAAVFAPAKGMIITVLALVTFDMITGIMAARKRKEPITSARIRDSVTKALLFEICLMLAFLTEQHLTGPEVPVCKWVAGLIGLSELKSVVENMDAVSGGALMKAILKKLGSENSDNEQ